VGQPCWSFAAGAGTGSHLHLDFGRKIPRAVPLTNPHLDPEARANDAEFALYLECVWRLDEAAGVVCGAWDDNAAGGPMLRGLARLPGLRVVQANVRQPGLDLDLEFEQALRLTVFCDQVNVLDEADNYSFFTPQGVLIVGTRSVPRLEPRETPSALPASGR
jgi:hypothetical protein